MLSKRLGKVGISLHRLLLYITLGGCMIAALVLIIVRYIPGVALYGIPEVITLSSAWLYFTGMAYVSYEKKHITVDLLSEKFAKSKSFSKYFGLVSSFLTIAVCVAYGYLAFKYCILVASKGQTTTDIGFPRVFLVSSIAFGFTLMTLYSVLQMVREIKALKNPEERRGA